MYLPLWAVRKVYVLINEKLNTFYLRLYGVRHMVKDHSYSERIPAVCGMVHIKEALLLIVKSKEFPFSLSEWSLTICLMPYNRK